MPEPPLQLGAAAEGVGMLLVVEEVENVEDDEEDEEEFLEDELVLELELAAELEAVEVIVEDETPEVAPLVDAEPVDVAVVDVGSVVEDASVLLAPSLGLLADPEGSGESDGLLDGFAEGDDPSESESPFLPGHFLLLHPEPVMTESGTLLSGSKILSII